MEWKCRRAESPTYFAFPLIPKAWSSENYRIKKKIVEKRDGVLSVIAGVQVSVWPCDLVPDP